MLGTTELIVLFGVIIIIFIIITRRRSKSYIPPRLSSGNRGGRTTALILIILIGGGIYYYYAFQQLDFQIENASIENISLSGVALEIYIRVQNPNPLPIVITSTKFDVYLNDQYIGKGISEATTIGGNGFRTIQTPVHITFSGLALGIINELTKGGVVTIEVVGEASLFIFSLPFTISKTINLI